MSSCVSGGTLPSRYLSLPVLGQTELKKQPVLSKCKRLQQLLDEHEHLLLARLGELDAQIVRRREENTTRLHEETACLSALIMELKGKCQLLAPELLQDSEEPKDMQLTPYQ
ncbi:hypothetical protein Y1Q_0022916 [Alligator mississippiensis]|uniref:Uncharacterized protein n=1 Tax=Alligator mississippiensis TaxID=8496 RepID=A0A151MHV0_ALLMI|nr:hypothetical protein Y1Q_0022916 [Alligator mississippiensis]